MPASAGERDLGGNLYSGAGITPDATGFYLDWAPAKLSGSARSVGTRVGGRMAEWSANRRKGEEGLSLRQRDHSATWQNGVAESPPPLAGASSKSVSEDALAD